MKLNSAWIGNNRKPLAVKAGKRYQVRWKLDPGHAKMEVERKRTNFRTIGECEAFITLLRHADLRMNEWCFDSAGQPVQANSLTSTVIESLGSYVEMRWYADWQPKTRDRVRGRLLQMVILTVPIPGEQRALFAAYELQRSDRGPRPEPTSTIEWAGRWLRDHALVPDAAEPTDERVLAGCSWIEQRSIGVGGLDQQVVTRLRRHFTQVHGDSTGRSYWQGTIVPFLNWLEATERITHKPLAGQTKMRRDVGAERPDRNDVFEPDVVAGIGSDMGEHHGEQWELWTLNTTYLALRLGESLAVNLSWYHCNAQGRWFYNPRKQIRTNTKIVADDGVTTKQLVDPKSRIGVTPPRRNAPLPTHLAERMIAYYGDDFGRADRFASVGPRGAIGNQQTVRTWFAASVQRTLGHDHHLADKKPHWLRHTGMTVWFASGADVAMVCQWGGWTSLKEMLDTYRGVITSLEAEELDGLDDFHRRWLHEQGSPTPPAVAPDAPIDFAAAQRARALRDAT